MAEGRVEGISKVTGSGKYAAEYKVDNVCYGVIVGSTIPAGEIEAYHLDDAKEVAGVLDIITHLNRPSIPAFENEESIKKSGFSLPVLHTDKVFFKGQPIALVIAETLEDATYAASLVTATYKQSSFNVDFDTTHPSIPLAGTGKERGTMDAWSNAAFVADAEYNIKHEVHNPMEMHATIATWVSKDKLKLWDKNQGVNNVQGTLSRLWKMPAANIEVISEFVGGGFGAGLLVWPHVLMTVMAAQQVKRPVKVVLTRPQMFTLVGYRPQAWQKVKIGADKDGNFLGILHQSKHSKSVYDNYREGITRISRMLYKIPNAKTEEATVSLNLSAPTWMRGPGDCSGAFGLECAIDELSYQLKKDPVQLRLQNLATEIDPDTQKPWSTNFLNECVEKGAANIEWAKYRKAQPASVKEGDWMIGYGMACGMWFAGRSKASAGIKMQKDGTISVETAMTDIGTGTGTGMQNIAHDNLGIPKNKIKVNLGNSNLPAAPSQGGSTGLSTMSGAVVAACNEFRKKIAELASVVDEAYKHVNPADIVFTKNGVALQTQGNRPVSYENIFAKNNLEIIDVQATSGPGEERQKYAFCSGAAHFVRVKVHAKTGKVKVDKIVSVVDAGYVVNDKAAANQISGAAVGGLGMALTEEQLVDHKLGCVVGNDLAGYHFPVNADAPIIDVSFIGKPDVNINPAGAKGLGEVGIIGMAPAVANAIYNATGKRLRNLPITPDKVLMA
ncbi:xanthine dehydrogenase YagR molybdenum-binding subunit [Chitinophaga skermanii]|uniref:Xanthine dehydrogenase YagR molybdenum-binding subunit n=2 Tax=Chitinophaga skermanii TaxID=331697 RepID=A0A327Q1E3_9BACT|nr:xanthine dehydrogenase YagR molybdenum-binding subunit [Chitinophaga skermanii]